MSCTGRRWLRLAAICIGVGQVADQMPPDYYAGVGKAAYVSALNSEKGIYNPTLA